MPVESTCHGHKRGIGANLEGVAPFRGVIFLVSPSLSDTREKTFILLPFLGDALSDAEEDNRLVPRAMLAFVFYVQLQSWPT